jgi:hypothetical protein
MRTPLNATEMEHVTTACLDKYIGRSDLEFCETDTDSAYIAISGESIEELIKPEFN